MPGSAPLQPRGSEWRRWDLQVHTPFSALNNGFGHEFNVYAKAIFETAISKKIAVVGVTDYFCIDGYKQLRAIQQDTDALTALLVDPSKVAAARRTLLIPNVELRTPVVITRPGRPDARVNLHVIFSDELTPESLEENFLRNLRFTAQGSPGGADEEHALTVANLGDLGRTLKRDHQEFVGHSDIFVGMMNAVVSHEMVTAALTRQDSRFKDRYLLVTPADEDLSECSWDGQAHLTRKLYIQKSHMLFSSNAGTRAFGLGEKHQTVEDFIREFKSKKPCIHGSDAHTYAELFEPAEGRALWVKSDPTFLGLRQVLYEPDERVFIGALPPSVERVASRPTKVMRSVTVRKKAGSTLTERWFDCDQPLNPELVAIIGNKGSGKSALSDILGLLGNTPRFGSFGFLRSDRFCDPKSNKAKHFEASLAWADATGDGPVSLDAQPESTAVEKVRYIPQNYLEEICNEVGLGRESRFYSELQKVIFSHVPKSDREEFETLDALLDHKGEEITEASVCSRASSVKSTTTSRPTSCGCHPGIGKA